MTDKVEITQLSTVVPERVQWLWPGYLPRGKLVTLDGDPGLGKSTLATDIGATITTGGRWPDGSTCTHPGAVLVMSAEDGLADTVRPRYDAAGADTTRVFSIEGVPILTEDGERVLRPPTLADVTGIDSAVRQTDARLLVVDVVMAYLPSGTDAHKDQDVRRVLSALSKVADETGCTVLLLRHLNKTKGGDPLYRGGGSIGIVGAARAGLLVAPDPDDPERRVLASVKSNLGPPPPSLAYRLTDVAEHGCARVQWEGSTDHTAHGLLAQPGAGDSDASERAAAENWLTDYLTEEGPTPAKAVKAAAAKERISERTLQRAKKNLGVIDHSQGFPRITVWSLPSRANQAESTPATQNAGATGATGPDQGKQVGATGQETQSRQPGESGATGAIPVAPTPLLARKQALATKRTITFRGQELPRCYVCGKGVVADQGDTHLSCRSKQVVTS